MSSPQTQTSEEIRFRCSRIGYLISGSEGLTARQEERLIELRIKQEIGKITDNQLIELGSLLDKQKNVKQIGKTTESYVKSVWLQNEFGYKEDVMTDEMMKGLLCEQDSFGLVKTVLGGEFRAKNKKRFRNEFVEGTPDVILKKEGFVEDVKSSYNLRTFTEAELIKLYEWQGQGYMWLTGKKKYRLIYCLVPTTDEIIVEQKKRWWFKFGNDDNNPHYMEMAMQIDHNNELIKRLAPEFRIKVFEFDFDPEKIELLKVKIQSCREYYKTLELKPYQKH